MSKESVTSFIEKAMQDSELREKLTKIDRNGDWAPPVVAIAKERGFDFTPDELREAVKSRFSMNGELSDEMLSNVAGGKSNSYSKC
jgi:predicted ribosomally synthesized peptide with nif11-like leader